MKRFRTTSRLLPLVLALVAGVLVLLWTMPNLDADFVADAAERFGPAAIVLLVALGIVVSPIPSGVIALGAGALYGTLWGGFLTIAGAGLGASCAFLLSRHFGRRTLLASHAPVWRFLTQERSQNGLMMAVFTSRLVPFISFDAVSYVAGLTPLTFPRFLSATLFGTAPVCIAFAAAGSGASIVSNPALLALCCGITLLLPALAPLRHASRKRAARLHTRRGAQPLSERPVSRFSHGKSLPPA